MTATNGDAKPAEASLISATDAGAVSSLIKELSAQGSNFDENTDDETRLSLCLKARELWKALETPRETMIRHCWGQVSQLNVNMLSMKYSHLASLLPSVP
jgi:hypothetical protein